MKALYGDPETLNDEEYMLIKEFSDIVKIPQEALRYLETKNLFYPAARGNDGNDNYRRYAVWQITTINMIRVLTDIKVSHEVIAMMNKERTPIKALKLLTKQKYLVGKQLRLYTDALTVLDTIMELLVESMCATEDEIALIERPIRFITMGDVNDFGGSPNYYRAFIRFCRTTLEPPLNQSFPIGGFFDSMDAFQNTPSQPMRFFSMNPRGHDSWTEGLYLTGYTRGPYGQTNDLLGRMTAYAKSEGLDFIGPVYCLYLQDEISVIDQNNFLLQASALVRETRRNLPKRVPPFINGD